MVSGTGRGQWHHNGGPDIVGSFIVCYLLSCVIAVLVLHDRGIILDSTGWWMLFIGMLVLEIFVVLLLAPGHKETKKEEGGDNAE